jgi:hypothetical protein
MSLQVPQTGANVTGRGTSFRIFSGGSVKLPTGDLALKHPQLVTKHEDLDLPPTLRPPPRR